MGKTETTSDFIYRRKEQFWRLANREILQHLLGKFDCRDDPHSRVPDTSIPDCFSYERASFCSGRENLAMFTWTLTTCPFKLLSLHLSPMNCSFVWFVLRPQWKEEITIRERNAAGNWEVRKLPSHWKRKQQKKCFLLMRISIYIFYLIDWLIYWLVGVTVLSSAITMLFQSMPSVALRAIMKIQFLVCFSK